MSERKDPGVAFWITVALVALLVAYPLSFGPACWITSWMHRGDTILPTIYQPVLSTWEMIPPRVRPAIRLYAILGSEYGWEWERLNGTAWRWVKFRFSDEERQRQWEKDRPEIERLNLRTRLRVEASLKSDPAMQGAILDPN